MICAKKNFFEGELSLYMLDHFEKHLGCFLATLYLDCDDSQIDRPLCGWSGTDIGLPSSIVVKAQTKF